VDGTWGQVIQSKNEFVVVPDLWRWTECQSKENEFVVVPDLNMRNVTADVSFGLVIG